MRKAPSSSAPAGGRTASRDARANRSSEPAPFGAGPASRWRYAVDFAKVSFVRTRASIETTRFPSTSSLGRDSLVGTALVLESLAVEAVPLSRRLAALPRYHGKKLRAALAPQDSLAVLLPRIEAAFPAGEPSRLDGLKLRFPDGSWFVARASNTEPILRVVAESPDAAWVDETLGRIEEILGAHASGAPD